MEHSVTHSVILSSNNNSVFLSKHAQFKKVGDVRYFSSLPRNKTKKIGGRLFLTSTSSRLIGTYLWFRQFSRDLPILGKLSQLLLDAFFVCGMDH